nr:hypothetical protein [Tanacetum cinerariifolium]
GEQSVYFDEDSCIEDIVNNLSVNETMFSEWMEANKIHDEAKKLTYLELPTKFMWMQDIKKWRPRKKGFSLGRVHHVSPFAGGAYFSKFFLTNKKSLRHGKKFIQLMSDLAGLIRKTKLIIWDEALMVNKHCFEALYRTLKDIMRSSKPFGGNNNGESKETKAFADWILNIGNGEVREDQEGKAEVEIPNGILIKDTSGDPIDAIINAIYLDFVANLSKPGYFEVRAILAPTNYVVNKINERMMKLIPTEERVYLSSNIFSYDETTGINKNLYSPDFLNTLQLFALPNHSLTLKKANLKFEFMAVAEIVSPCYKGGVSDFSYEETVVFSELEVASHFLFVTPNTKIGECDIFRKVCVTEKKYVAIFFFLKMSSKSCQSLRMHSIVVDKDINEVLLFFWNGTKCFCSRVVDRLSSMVALLMVKG